MANPRHQRQTQPTSRRKPANPIAVAGEKAVKKTERTTDVRPADVPPDREPRPQGPAVDQRTQFSGSDEAKPKPG